MKILCKFTMLGKGWLTETIHNIAYSKVTKKNNLFFSYLDLFCRVVCLNKYENESGGSVVNIL